MITKSLLREEYLKKRNAMTAVEVGRKSADIAEKLFALPEYIEAKTIFTFIGVNNEVATQIIVEKALSDGKLVAAPVVRGKRRMFFIRINSLDGLVRSPFGVLEPLWDEDEICMCDEKTLIIVPGLLFDQIGYRIGYGGGYYDRYLSENRRLACVGVAYGMQLVTEVPKQAYDQAVDLLITEGGVHRPVS